MSRLVFAETPALARIQKTRQTAEATRLFTLTIVAAEVTRLKSLRTHAPRPEGASLFRPTAASPACVITPSAFPYPAKPVYSPRLPHMLSRLNPIKAIVATVTRGLGAGAILWLVMPVPAQALEPVPDKLAVLTFDDSVASHYSVVRPILKRLGFRATFFITEGFSFQTNKKDCMTWEQIAELHRDGFEIGNHTRDHR